jgi:predicted Zn-dependent peptidase
MNYKKILKDNYTLHLVDTDRFKMMNVVVFFSKKFDKEDLKYGGLLVKNLVYSSKKYNTKNKIAIVGEELYGAGVSSSFNVIGNTSEIVFSLEFLNPKYTSADYLEKSVDFLYEVLFNPNISIINLMKRFFILLIMK